MRKSLFLGLALASAMTLGTAAFAAGQDGGPRFGGEHGHHSFGMGMQKLNLTDAQKASIHDLVKNSFGQNKPQRDSLRAQRQAFESMTPDQVGYQAAAVQLAQAEGTATQTRVQQQAQLKAQIYALLTTQQKAQWVTLKQEREQRRQQWMQLKAQQKAAASSSTTAQ
ncbi:Spy/CpxP family protein refolding chaperone [Dyella sp. 2RAB6]|uniref:Spy/CpxP family protein refolding chaperone n=1 Tax=Dyella sp. 2RAB6 TaxID=3232992 RepID=UPI003F8DD8F9